MMLLERVRTRLVADGAPATLAGVAQALRREGIVVGDAAALELVRALRDDLVGAGPLELLLREPGVTDVLVNGPREVYVDRGQGLERTDLDLGSDDDVRRLAQRLATSTGRRLDDASPFVDACLPDGIRLHAALPPLAVDGTVLSLRVPSRRALTLDDLVTCGTVDETGAQALADLISSRTSFLVSGGTGAGKTTILGALLGLEEPQRRVVIVEDATELHPDHPHVVRLQSRVANAEGAGTVSLRDLVRQALRMRPDRLVVGEVRGPEVVDLLIALNTGHEGGCGTVHANSAADVPARIEALALLAGLDRAAAHALLASAVRAVVHVARAGSDRQVRSVHVLDRAAGGVVVMRSALTRRGDRLVPDEAHDVWQALVR